MVARASFHHGGDEHRIDITLTDLRGVVRAQPANPPRDVEDMPAALPMALTMALNDWFDKRPHQRLLCVVPVVWQGYTVELHAWYTAIETADATSVDLQAHRLTDGDFAEFERDLKKTGAQLTARLDKAKSPQGTSYIHLSHVRLTYPPARRDDVERLLRAYGFEPGR